MQTCQPYGAASDQNVCQNGMRLLTEHHNDFTFVSFYDIIHIGPIRWSKTNGGLMKAKLLDNVQDQKHIKFSGQLQNELEACGMLDDFYDWLIIHDASVMKEAQKVMEAL